MTARRPSALEPRGLDRIERQRAVDARRGGARPAPRIGGLHGPPGGGQPRPRQQRPRHARAALGAQRADGAPRRATGRRHARPSRRAAAADGGRDVARDGAGPQRRGVTGGGGHRDGRAAGVRHEVRERGRPGGVTPRRCPRRGPWRPAGRSAGRPRPGGAARSPGRPGDRRRARWCGRRGGRRPAAAPRAGERPAGRRGQPRVLPRHDDRERVAHALGGLEGVHAPAEGDERLRHRAPRRAIPRARVTRRGWPPSAACSRNEPEPWGLRAPGGAERVDARPGDEGHRAERRSARRAGRGRRPPAAIGGRVEGARAGSAARPRCAGSGRARPP